MLIPCFNLWGLPGNHPNLVSSVLVRSTFNGFRISHFRISPVKWPFCWPIHPSGVLSLFISTLFLLNDKVVLGAGHPSYSSLFILSLRKLSFLPQVLSWSRFEISLHCLFGYGQSSSGLLICNIFLLKKKNWFPFYPKMGHSAYSSSIARWLSQLIYRAYAVMERVCFIPSLGPLNQTCWCLLGFSASSVHFTGLQNCH